MVPQVELPAAVIDAVDGGAISAASVRLVEQMGVFGMAYRRFIETSAGRGGLSVARLRVLWLLHGGGPLIMRELCEGLGVSPRNVTQLVDGLESDGLARRAPHPSDRRATVIELTTDGEAMVSECWGAHVLEVAALFERLEGDDRESLLRVVEQLVGQLESLGVDVACGPGGHPTSA
ncbi:MarR family winged helix-turn-helix transcriptional regulator [Euzebya tangerina]|uniref:MarR family winged helix-turn-helix transcriptional regulator n=1 Tax=Euzebya tangerina TaxID=591198 RepID=UPI0013C30C81|nr:MarR family winged helix-turn-helix transcriptional regulator [Euzebya tangerina]